ncbi:hypothetical protein BJ138DRAFT_1144431 [Hygrophoropsis aurantiaca]|uniref:Uncharacterized protein n=1 Tax=Hygrophoropsis aurantiaca TaxID=72124 RepID=A0ACB8ALS1_9AGAM|nr:hypothetical protein BJ138DRAFT_1144431 [Hygrophoropsis aurantiaca]
MVKKWYVVRVGTIPGVYTTWIEASAKIEGVVGAVHQSFESLEEARAAFEGALARGEVRAVRAHPGSVARSEHSEDTIENELLLSPTQSASAPVSRRKNNIGNIFQTRPRSTIESNQDPIFTTSFTEGPTEVTQYVPLESSPFVTPRRRQSPRATVVSDSSRAYPDPSNTRSWHESDFEAALGHNTGNKSSPSNFIDEARTPRTLHRAATSPDVSYPDTHGYRPYVGKREIWGPPNLRRFKKERDADVSSAPVRLGGGDASPAFHFGNDQSDDGNACGELGARDNARLPSTYSSSSLIQDSSPRRARGLKGKGKAKVLDAMPPSPVPVEHREEEMRPTLDSPFKCVPRSHCGENMHAYEYKITVYCPHPDKCQHHPAGYISSVFGESCGGGVSRSKPQYVDAVVSPMCSASSIRSSHGHIGSFSDRDVGHARDSEAGNTRFFGVPHAPYSGHNAEVDIRSPIAKGTRVPVEFSEFTNFGRPSPPMQATVKSSGPKYSLTL